MPSIDFLGYILVRLCFKNFQSWYSIVYPDCGSATRSYSVVAQHTGFMPWRNHKKPIAKSGWRLIHVQPPSVSGVRCEYPVENWPWSYEPQGACPWHRDQERNYYTMVNFIAIWKRNKYICTQKSAFSTSALLNSVGQIVQIEWLHVINIYMPQHKGFESAALYFSCSVQSRPPWAIISSRMQGFV